MAIVNASAFSTHAQAALIETLKTMSARMTPETTVTLPWTGEKLDCHGFLAEPQAVDPLRAMLFALQKLIRDAA